MSQAALMQSMLEKTTTIMDVSCGHAVA